ncbi:hypothetical protein CYPRO_0430 [Cyclonatronum proteinivorum]|uniref:Uncharacterized protein n=1 Tax=Cyclonatronum proteinivorum TaxID=1457365 RepID=A0A345UGW5_9BACT|nr:hypothetical protein [Cyclonatronum proteinivorum]AXI99716.1 hypothetical protein CYPRO_0430 [Cyclonatronum proteinivorum]
MSFKAESPADNFKSISVHKFVKLYKKSNPREDAEMLKKDLIHFRSLKSNGQKCNCGNPIWAIGSAISGMGCFTCITGETDSSNDYEIA